MAEVPVLDWRCTHCGHAETWQLVKPEPGQDPMPMIDWNGEVLTLDWRCSRCGTATTWQLVPMRAESPPKRTEDVLTAVQPRDGN